MKRLVWVMVLALAAPLAGCKKDTPASDGKKDDKKATDKDKKPPAPPAPYTGPLTGDRIMGAKSLVQPLQPWADANAALEGQMGKATFVKGKWYSWGVVEGDTCTYFKVEKQDDGNVGAVQSPMKVEKDGPEMNRSECLEAAGQKKDDAAAEDPNAPGPPTDGKAVTVAELRDGIAKAKSKWLKQSVKVTGVYVGTTKAKSGDEENVMVSVSGAKGDIQATVGCQLSDPKTAPEKMMQWSPITVEGTANETFGGGLDDCKIDADDKAPPAPKK
jgi:hypothetical protein